MVIMKKALFLFALLVAGSAYAQERDIRLPESPSKLKPEAVPRPWKTRRM